MRIYTIALMGFALWCGCYGCEKHRQSSDEKVCVHVRALIEAMKTNLTVRCIRLSGNIRESLKKVGDAEKKRILILGWSDALFNVSVEGLKSEIQYEVIKESATVLDWDVVCAMHDTDYAIGEVWGLRFQIVDWLDNHLIRMRKMCDEKCIDCRERRAAWTSYQALAEFREQIVENFERFCLDDRDFIGKEGQLRDLREKLSAKIGRPARRPSEIKMLGIYVRQVREQIRKDRDSHEGL